MKYSKIIKTATLGLLTLGLTSCDEETLSEIISSLTNLNEGDGYYSGYNFEDENLDELERDINMTTKLGSGSQLSSTNIPSKVDLTSYLPPIGNQGQYGTCVAWATAYNCRSFLNAKSNGLSKSSLTYTSNQFSPKDIFFSIDNNYKGDDCGGTNFEYAFDQMVSRGVATMEKVPYTNLGNCSSKVQSDWTSDANKHKIKSYRQININANEIKTYLAQGHLVVFGAKLGDEFMYSNSSDILYTQTSFNYTGQHSYHAMVLSGYDESKGNNGAFRVVNSWGTSWGDDGYIWVDEKFFCSGNFAYCAFVAYDGSDVTIDTDSNEVAEEDRSNGIDLIATELDFYDFDDPEFPDDSDDPCWRSCYYDVYNAGTQTVSSSKNWGICLLYYNAYDANDFGVLFLDFYTNQYGSKGDYDFNWDGDEAYYALGLDAQGYAWNNVDVYAGQSVSKAVTGIDKGFTFDFKMPEDLTGQYYLVIAADAFDGIQETDEDNNYLYYTAANNKPIKFVNGVAQNLTSKSTVRSKGKQPAMNSKTACQDVRTPDNVNAYTPDEISAMITAHKKSGVLSKKARVWKESNNGHRGKRIVE